MNNELSAATGYPVGPICDPVECTPTAPESDAAACDAFGLSGEEAERAIRALEASTSGGNPGGIGSSDKPASDPHGLALTASTAEGDEVDVGAALGGPGSDKAGAAAGGTAAPSPGLSFDEGVEGVPPTLLSLRQCHEQMCSPNDLGTRAPAYITLKRWSGSQMLASAMVRVEGGARPLYDLAKIRAICLGQMARRFTTAANSREIDEILAGVKAAPADSARTSEGDPSAGRPTSVEPAGPVSLHQESLHRERGSSAVSEEALAAAVSRAMTGVMAAVAGLEMKLARSEANMEAMHSEMSATIAALTRQVERAAVASEGLESVRRTLMARTDGELTALRGQVAALRESRELPLPLRAAKPQPAPRAAPGGAAGSREPLDGGHQE